MSDDLSTISERTRNMQDALSRIEKMIRDDYVTVGDHEILKERVRLLQQIVFGLIALILVQFFRDYIVS